jgi:hypothetical protein
MRIVEHASDLQEMMDACIREAKASFASTNILIEKYLRKPRHVELQVFGDTHGRLSMHLSNHRYIYINHKHCARACVENKNSIYGSRSIFLYLSFDLYRSIDLNLSFTQPIFLLSIHIYIYIYACMTLSTTVFQI